MEVLSVPGDVRGGRSDERHTVSNELIEADFENWLLANKMVVAQGWPHICAEAARKAWFGAAAVYGPPAGESRPEPAGYIVEWNIHDGFADDGTFFWAEEREKVEREAKLPGRRVIRLYSGPAPAPAAEGERP